MDNAIERKIKLPAFLNRAPIWLFFLAILFALSILGAQVAKLIKDEDTQGVYYGGTPEGYKKRYAQMMGGSGGGRGGGNGTQSSGYGKNRPSPPAGTRTSGGGYAGR